MHVLGWNNAGGQAVPWVTAVPRASSSAGQLPATPTCNGARSGTGALIAPSVQGDFANVSVEHQPWRGTSSFQVISVSESIKELHSAGSVYSSVYEFYLHIISTLNRI